MTQMTLFNESVMWKGREENCLMSVPKKCNNKKKVFSVYLS